MYPFKNSVVSRCTERICLTYIPFKDKIKSQDTDSLSVRTRRSLHAIKNNSKFPPARTLYTYMHTCTHTRGLKHGCHFYTSTHYAKSKNRELKR